MLFFKNHLFVLNFFRYGKETNQKGVAPTGQTSKIDFIQFCAILYATFMAVYFGCTLDSPVWGFLFFFLTNLLALALSLKLRKYERRSVYLVIIVLQVLGMIYNTLFYLFEAPVVSQVAGFYFLIGLLLLIFLRKK